MESMGTVAPGIYSVPPYQRACSGRLMSVFLMAWNWAYARLGCGRLEMRWSRPYTVEDGTGGFAPCVGCVGVWPLGAGRELDREGGFDIDVEEGRAFWAPFARSL